MPGKFHVNGLYYFANPGKDTVKKLSIYPFPAGNSLGEVDSVFCEQRTRSNKINKDQNDYIEFEITVPPEDTVIYRIAYQQYLKGSPARYILTTTSSWGKAFDTANYSLLVEDLEVDSLSYIPDKVEISEDSLKFLWKKRNFMPDRDMVIYFHEAGLRQASD